MLIRVHGELSDDLFQVIFIVIMLITKYVGWIRIIFTIMGTCILMGYGIFSLISYFQNIKQTTIMKY